MSDPMDIGDRVKADHKPNTSDLLSFTDNHSCSICLRIYNPARIIDLFNEN